MPHRVLKVVFASHLSCLEGGAQLCLLEVASALERDERIEPVVTVPSDGPLAAALRAESVRCCILPTPWWVLDADGTIPRILRLGLLRRSWRSLGIARSLVQWCRWLRTERPDVVVTNTAVIPTPAIAGALARIPHVWWVHEFVTKDHGLTFVLGERLSQRLIDRLSQQVVANSRAVRDHFSPPISAERIRVVYEGSVGFAPMPNRIDPSMLRVLLIGVLSPTKGVETAIEAARMLTSEQVRLHLRVVGPLAPRYRRRLERLVTDLGVTDCVEIAGASTDPHAEFEWANVVVMCSRCEAFGRVTVEGLKSGRPVVGTRCGGTPELITDGVNGFLFTPGAAEELASVLKRLKQEPRLLETLSENAGTGVRDRFTIECEVEELVEVIRSAAARQKPAIRERRP